VASGPHYDTAHSAQEGFLRKFVQVLFSVAAAIALGYLRLASRHLSLGWQP